MSSSFKDLEEISKKFIDLLLKGDFTAAASKFDDQMKSTVDEVKLQETWIRIVADAGALLQINPIQTTESEGYSIIIIRYDFQRTIIDVRFVFNQEEQIRIVNQAVKEGIVLKGSC